MPAPTALQEELAEAKPGALVLGPMSVELSSQRGSETPLSGSPQRKAALQSQELRCVLCLLCCQWP